MPRLTADTWETIRAEREAGEVFDALAARYTVSKTAIVNRAKKEGWGDGQDIAGVVRRKVTEKVTGIVTTDNPKKKAEAIDAAVNKVAAVVESHKREWDDHRQRFGSVPADFEDGKLMKIAGEAIAIRQKGERTTWGLDEPAATPANSGPQAMMVIQIAGQQVDVKALGWHHDK